MITRVIIPIRAIAKQRPRLNKHNSVYTPQKTKDFEQIIKLYYRNNYFYNNEYIRVKILFKFAIPKSYTKKQYNDAIYGNLRPTRADIDNYIKATLDGLNGIAWSDDRYIVSIEAEKMFTDKDEIEIEIDNCFT